jgi:glycosyltransferase involved in cell wall biosynthesis
MKTDYTKVSVVVPAYNEETNVDGLLNAIFCDSLREPDELIIVDAGSSDETVTAVKNWANNHTDCNIIVIEMKSRAYPGKARNLGVKNASNNIIAFIDMGVTPSSGWLNELMMKMRHDVDIVWGKVESKVDTTWEKSFALLTSNKKNQVIKCIPSMCIAVDTFLKLGGFPEDLRAGEDLVFKKKLAKMNLNEDFAEAIAYYSGYPKTLVEAFRKWMQYSEHSVYAGVYVRKLALVLLLTMCIFVAILIGVLFTSPYLTISLLIFIWVCRVFIPIIFGEAKIMNCKSIIFAVIIVPFIDAGRIVGLIKGCFYKLLEKGKL